MNRQEHVFEGTINTCAHYVKFRYWDFESELTDELQERLTKEAETHAKDCIIEGYESGDLTYLHISDDDTEEQIWGWWEIDRS